MRLLLDTHVFLWLIEEPQRLSGVVLDAIGNPSNEVYLSVVSLWEAVIKYQLGKLPLPEPAHLYLPDQRMKHQIASLPLDEGSISQLPGLPAIHRDPFDRILVCQAIEHRLAMVTVDTNVRSYPVTIFG